MVPFLVFSTLLVSSPQQVVRTFYDRWTRRPLAAPMAVVDDLDNDGLREFLIGEVGEPFGEMRILSGDSGDLIQRIQRNELYFGYAVEFVGDVTGDGVGDFLGSGYLGNRGHLWDGATRARLWDGTSFDSAAGIGDIDGDGIGDFVVAYYGINGIDGLEGSATVLYGGRYQTAYVLTQPGAESYGDDAVALGDVDGDGIGDFAIGAPDLVLSEGCSPGEVFTYSGVDGRLIHRLQGEGVNSGFGEFLAALGDVTGDGLGDLAISARLCCDVLCGSGGAGSVYFYDGASGKLLERVDAPGGITWFGDNIVEVGDLDGNGFGDVLVGGRPPSHAVGTQLFETMFAIDGGTRDVIYSFWNEARDRCAYVEMSAAGDMDGDDFPDFHLSSFCITGIVDDRIEVFSGAPLGVRTLATPCDPEAKHLRIGATGVPRIGTHYRFHLTGLGPGVEARLLVGTQPPGKLDGYRVRRCPGVAPVQIFSALTKPLRNGDGVASVALPIPYRAELIGSKIYAQWVLRDGERLLRSRILELEIQPVNPYRDR